MPKNGRTTKENESVGNSAMKESEVLKIGHSGGPQQPTRANPSASEDSRKAVLGTLTTPLLKQNADLLKMLEEQLSANRAKEALDTAHVFFAKSRLLYEVYESSAEVYYCGLLYLAISHLANRDFLVADKHFRTVAKAHGSTDLLAASPQMGLFRRLALVGSFICAAEVGKFVPARKLFDLLEEESLDDLPESLLIRFRLSESLVFEEDADATRTAEKLSHLAARHLLLDNPKINILQKIQFTLRICELLLKAGQPEDAMAWRDKYLAVFQPSASDVTPEVLFSHVEVLVLGVRLAGEVSGSSESERNSQISAAYKAAAEVLFGSLRSHLSESNSKAFLSPLRKYIVHLSKCEAYTEALQMTNRLLAVEEEFFGHFHPHVAKTYELKGKLLDRCGEGPAALESLTVAYDIFTDLNDKDAAAAVRQRIVGKAGKQT